jgi:hypothetical protein
VCSFNGLELDLVITYVIPVCEWIGNFCDLIISPFLLLDFPESSIRSRVGW